MARKKRKVELDLDDPDYRYWDFRDEILQVERIRTIGGKNGQNKEESKEEAKSSRQD